MSLDSKQKRGSVISMTLPFRSWIANPSGTIDMSKRLSILYLEASSADTPSYDYGIGCYKSSLGVSISMGM